MKRWLWLCGWLFMMPAWVQNEIYFSDDFEVYTGQRPNNDENNVFSLEIYDNICSPVNTSDIVWRIYDVWHGVPNPPNMQLVNVATPYVHPDPFYPPDGGLCTTWQPASQYVPQPDPIPGARSGLQMLWARASGDRTQYVNLSLAASGGTAGDNPLYDGAYFDFWFYDDSTFDQTSRSMGEFRSYSNTFSGIPATTLFQIYSLGAYDADSGLSRKHYNLRADVTTGYFTPDEANGRHWANFRQVMRSTGWHHAAIWLTRDNQNTARVTYVIDGIARQTPRNPAHRMTTAVLRHLNDTGANARQMFYDDVEVGTGTPPAYGTPLFVGRVLPGDWRTDHNGYADVAEWIVDVEIFDTSNNLLMTLERRLPKKDPAFNFVDGTEDYTGLIGIPDLLPQGTYQFRFKLRNRPWIPVTLTLTTPAIGNVVVLPNGDVTLDGVVDDADLSEVIFHFGEDATTSPATDLNGDGQTNDADLGIVIFNFGERG